MQPCNALQQLTVTQELLHPSRGISAQQAGATLTVAHCTVTALQLQPPPPPSSFEYQVATECAQANAIGLGVDNITCLFCVHVLRQFASISFIVRGCKSQSSNHNITDFLCETVHSKLFSQMRRGDQHRCACGPMLPPQRRNEREHEGLVHARRGGSGVRGKQQRLNCFDLLGSGNMHARPARAAL